MWNGCYTFIDFQVQLRFCPFFDTGIIKVNVNMTYNLFHRVFLLRLLCLRLYGSIAYYYTEHIMLTNYPANSL